MGAAEIENCICVGFKSLKRPVRSSVPSWKLPEDVMKLPDVVLPSEKVEEKEVGGLPGALTDS